MSDRTAFILVCIIGGAASAGILPLLLGVDPNIVLAAALGGAGIGAIWARANKGDFSK